MPPIVHAYPDHATLITAAAALVAREIAVATRTRGRAWVVLSGGETPRALYAALAASDQAPPSYWENTWWCFGDERWVPRDDPLSNFRMADGALFARAPIPRAQIVTVPTDVVDPVQGARAYEHALRRHFADSEWPTFDLALMGLGADGHTASLFPGDRGSDERTAWATTTRAGEPVPNRVTLTAPVFAHARVMVFLVTGESKADAVSATLTGPLDPTRWPAQAVIPPAGRCVWLLDRAAAAKLPSGFARA